MRARGAEAVRFSGTRHGVELGGEGLELFAR